MVWCWFCSWSVCGGAGIPCLGDLGPAPLAGLGRPYPVTFIKCVPQFDLLLWNTLHTIIPHFLLDTFLICSLGSSYTEAINTAEHKYFC